MKIGIRAHDIQIFDDVENLAIRLEKLGFNYIQFAPRVSLAKTTQAGTNVNFGLAQTVKTIFAQHDIQIAVLGCYVNIINPDINEREKSLELFKHYLILSRYFGSNLVATETGSVDPDFNLTPVNYQSQNIKLATHQIKKLIISAEKLGNLVGIEPGVNHPIYSIDVMQRLLHDIDSPNLQVIVDPANLVTNSQEKVSDVINQAIHTFGNSIYCFHLKDYVIKNGRAYVVPLGEGIADLERSLQIIKEQQPYAFVIFDETPQENLTQSIVRMKALIEKI